MDGSEVKVTDRSGQPPSQQAQAKGREHLIILRRVRRHIEQSVADAKKHRFLVGLSGGVDSAVLLHILCDWRDRKGPEIVAAHVHHGTRGEESDRDMEVAEKIARMHGAPFHVLHLRGIRFGESSETILRERRLGELEQLAQKLEARGIVLAHHRDDQAETILYRLLGGSDLKGLGGMAVFRPPGWLHPLLTTSRCEIEAEAKACKLPYIEDSTNRSLKPRRNFLRHQVIPLLEKEFNPRLAEHLCALGESAARASDFLDQEARIWADASRVEAYTFSVEVLRKAPKAVRYQILQQVFCEVQGKYGALQRKQVAALDHLLTTDGRPRVMPLPRGVVVARRENVIVFSRNV